MSMLNPFSQNFGRRLDNLKLSRHRYHLPLWRAPSESDLLRRLVLQWEHKRQKYGFAECGKRALARKLGCSQTWVQKLCREYRQAPERLQRIVLRKGMASFEQLLGAQEQTRQMRERGQLRKRIRWHTRHTVRKHWEAMKYPGLKKSHWKAWDGGKWAK